MSSATERTSSLSSTVEETTSPPTVHGGDTPPSPVSPYPLIQQPFYLSGDFLDLDEIISLSKNVAEAIISCNPPVHTLLDHMDEDDRLLADTALLIATLDFKSSEPPVDTFRPAPDGHMWSPATLVRTYTLLRYREHARWYTDSSKSSRQQWIKRLNCWGCWIKREWEIEAGNRVVDAINADEALRIRLSSSRGRRVRLRLQEAMLNDMFLLYFRLGQHEELDKELRVLGAPRMPRLPLNLMHSNWCKLKDQEEQDERETEELAQTIHQYVKRRRLAS